MHAIASWALACGAAVGLLAACGSSGSGANAPAPCASGAVPATIHVTVSGFSKCSCLNGTFALTQVSSPASTSNVWISGPLRGCPGGQFPAYVQFSTESTSFGLAISASVNGTSPLDFSAVTSGTCSPIHLQGGGSRAGNILEVCSDGAEDTAMSWSLAD